MYSNLQSRYGIHANVRLINSISRINRRVNKYCDWTLQDPRFSGAVDGKTGVRTRSMLSVPIRNADGDVIGVAQAVNRISDATESFDDQDERVSGHLNYDTIQIQICFISAFTQFVHRYNLLIAKQKLKWIYIVFEAN